MNYTIENMTAFQVIGFTREFNYNTCYQEIPGFWDWYNQTFAYMMQENFTPQTDLELAMCYDRIGEFGVCISEPDKLKYMIAGIYKGKEKPDGLDLYDIPASQWAKFAITGPLPGSLQTVNTWVWNEWLPNNDKYIRNGNISFEWYSLDDPKKPDYQSGIWIPIKNKR